MTCREGFITCLAGGVRGGLRRVWGVLWLVCSAIVPLGTSAAISFSPGSQEILQPFGQGSFVSGDIDGDLDPDLLVMNGEEVTIYENDGTGNFSAAGALLDGRLAQSLALHDVDGDGDLEIWLRNSDGGGELWRNVGDLAFSMAGAAVPDPGTGPVAFGDLNGDGVAEIIVANQGHVGGEPQLENGGIVVWSTGPDLEIGSMSTVLTVPNEQEPDNAGDAGDALGVVAGDLDQDGDLDIVGRLGDSSLRTWINSGEGEMTLSDDVVLLGEGLDGSVAVNPVLMDMDADSDLDLIVSEGPGGVNGIWKNDGSGVFTVSDSLLPEQRAILLPVDIDNDRDRDLIVAGNPCSFCPQIYFLGDEALTASDVSLFSSNATVHAMRATDVDGDGDQDIIARVDVIEAPAGRGLVGVWFNSLIDLSVTTGGVGSITDATLGFVVRQRMGLPADLAVNPDYEELKRLVVRREDFGQEFVPIASLTGLEEAVYLEELELEGVLRLGPEGQNIADLRAFVGLHFLRVLRLENNGLDGLILPASWESLEELWVGGNRLRDADFISNAPNLRNLGIASNQIVSLSLNQPTRAWADVEIGGNPLETLSLDAGLSGLSPSIESLREAGATVSIRPRIRALPRSADGFPQFIYFGDAGRHQVRLTRDFVNWEPIGELVVERANWPGVVFTDRTAAPDDGFAFYSVLPAEM